MTYRGPEEIVHMTGRFLEDFEVGQTFQSGCIWRIRESGTDLFSANESLESYHARVSDNGRFEDEDKTTTRREDLRGLHRYD